MILHNIEIEDLKYRFGYLSCYIRNHKHKVPITAYFVKTKFYNVPYLLFNLIKDCIKHSNKINEKNGKYIPMKNEDVTVPGYIQL